MATEQTDNNTITKFIDKSKLIKILQDNEVLLKEKSISARGESTIVSEILKLLASGQVDYVEPTIEPVVLETSD